MRFRLGLTYFSLLAVFALIGFRLVQLQVLDNKSLEAQAEKQYGKATKQAAYRSPILDRNGKDLAVSVRAASIFSHPRLVKDKYQAATVLSKHLGKSRNHWIRKLRSKKNFIWIQRQVDEIKGRQIAKAKINGLFVKPENTRLYPNGALAAQVLGFTDIDGRGLSGVEFGHNEQLLNNASGYPVLRDGQGNPAYIERNPESQVGKSGGVYLTIDRTLQYVLEEELKETLEQTQAKGAMAIVMDPFTGEVLAMGQLPSFNPNRAHKYSNRLFANRLISHLYEPGSTLKVLFAAEAIEKKLFKRNSIIDGHNGRLKIGKKVFREAEPHKKHKKLTFAEVIRYSSNIGAIQIAQKLGARRVRNALLRFGFNRKTGIGLPGEVTGSLRGASHWTPIRLANISFGQGVSVTPLQMVTAFSAFANGGYWIKPKIYRAEVNAVTKKNLDIKRVLSPRTAKTIKQILVSVAEHKKGSGRRARIEGLRVGGKTGTAQKYESGKGYRSGKYFTSFIGFLPADHPQLVIGVFIDEPRKRYYGSQIAAPLFQRIAKRAIHLLDKTPKKIAVNYPRRITRPFPQKVAALPLGKKDNWTMPNLSGMSLREALSILGTRFSDIRLSGNGYVVQQTPPPGKSIRQNSRIHLKFSPAS